MKNVSNDDNFLDLDLTNTEIKIEKAKSEINDFDFLSTHVTDNQSNKQEFDLFDFTKEKKDHGNINIIVNSNVNNINIQNFKYFN